MHLRYLSLFSLTLTLLASLSAMKGSFDSQDSLRSIAEILTKPLDVAVSVESPSDILFKNIYSEEEDRENDSDSEYSFSSTSLDSTATSFSTSYATARSGIAESQTQTSQSSFKPQKKLKRKGRRCCGCFEPLLRECVAVVFDALESKRGRQCMQDMGKNFAKGAKHELLHNVTDEERQQLQACALSAGKQVTQGVLNKADSPEGRMFLDQVSGKVMKSINEPVRKLCLILPHLIGDEDRGSEQHAQHSLKVRSERTVDAKTALTKSRRVREKQSE
jgi:hypothetical protein